MSSKTIVNCTWQVDPSKEEVIQNITDEQFTLALLFKEFKAEAISNGFTEHEANEYAELCVEEEINRGKVVGENIIEL